jgi:hypothetical protein
MYIQRLPKSQIGIVMTKQYLHQGRFGGAAIWRSLSDFLLFQIVLIFCCTAFPAL